MKRLLFGLLALVAGFALSSSTASAAGTTHNIEFNAPYPKTLEVEEGDSIVFYKTFKSDPGLFDPIAFPGAKNTDKKSGDVLNHITPVIRLDKDTIRVGQFDAKRVGEAEITIDNLKGSDTIKVTVTAAKPTAVVVDLSKKIPTSIDLAVGQNVVFENGTGTITTTDNGKGGTLLDKRPHNTLNQLAAYSAKRTGSGEITVKLSSQGLLTVARTFTIKVTVK